MGYLRFSARRFRPAHLPNSRRCGGALGLLTLFVAGLMLAVHALPAGSPLVPPGLAAQLGSRYGEGAERRLRDWEALLLGELQSAEEQRLEQVNGFLNRLPFISDRMHWGVPDYWATPAEFLASNGGDCEDFAIAKLFSLHLLEVPAHKLRLMYVNALSINQPHMVLLYKEEEDAPALVLDNLVGDIRKASERSDLQPVYSFNTSGLWLNRRDAPEQRLRERSGSLLWEDLLERIKKEGFDLAAL